MKSDKIIILFLVILTPTLIILISYQFRSNFFIDRINYTTVISFGDSLSDNGNTYNKSSKIIPNNNTWFKGRFSNDKVWVEYLCSYAKNSNCTLIDNAYGGAYSGDGYQDIKLNDEPILKLITNLYQQIQNFVKKDKSYNPDTTLYTINIGGNDIMDLDASANQVAKNVDKTIGLLIKKKNAKHIAFLNLPDFSKAPRYSKASAKKRKNIHDKIVKTNKLTKKIIIKYQNEGIDIKIVDFYKLLNSLIKDKKLISDKPCLDISLKTDKLDFLLMHDKTNSCKTNLNKYIFFDNLHPTNTVHQKLAELTKKQF